MLLGTNAQDPGYCEALRRDERRERNGGCAVNPRVVWLRVMGRRTVFERVCGILNWGGGEGGGGGGGAPPGRLGPRS